MKSLLFLCVLPLAGLASPSQTACHTGFQAPRFKASSPTNKDLKKQSLVINLADKKKNLLNQNLVNEKPLNDNLFYPQTNESGSVLSLHIKWKAEVKKKLPHFNKSQLFNLFDNLVSLKKRGLDLSSEKPFILFLEKHITTLLPYFNKQQLVEVIWFFVQLEIKPSQQEFISLWRKNAREIQQEFSSKERYTLYYFFRTLGVPPPPPQQQAL